MAAVVMTGVGNYLLLGMPFVYLDPAIPVWGYALLYALLAAGAATAGHVARCLLATATSQTR